VLCGFYSSGIFNISIIIIIIIVTIITIITITQANESVVAFNEQTIRQNTQWIGATRVTCDV